MRTYPFPAVEEPAEVAEPAEEEEVPETEVVVEAEESLPEMVDEVASEAVEPEATEAEEDTEETPAEEQSFEELFKMESIRRQKEDLEPSYEEEMGYAPPKKQSRKASKKKRGYTVEYDPDLDEDIVRYKHKGDDDWEDW